jgi:hypothetical protein
VTPPGYYRRTAPLLVGLAALILAILAVALWPRP